MVSIPAPMVGQKATVEQSPALLSRIISCCCSRCWTTQAQKVTLRSATSARCLSSVHHVVAVIRDNHLRKAPQFPLEEDRIADVALVIKARVEDQCRLLDPT
jgi:hypothetical protein